ncbi:hypothetical protein [Clostridium botulinum]|uniref:hypothetical protein n=1 Tax=Clostridium botulinum TaxID=1491 RepID=UPI0013F06AD9|nr:hypothetical protein [Clostridium botulinum]NFD34479.1 hypothetical protein [Clostridium botulinum]NFD58321.1 hypothetical protein [Clostridium botulinum]NFE02437.1 hypothetical protein [Clostridium botulinum]
MDRILRKIASARWLISIMMTIVFAILAIRNMLNTEFITIYTMIIAFYFSKDRKEVGN